MHYNLNGFAGNYNTYGQGISASTNSGKLGYFFSGSHQTTDMRKEPVILDPTTNEVENFHNHGEDWYGFGKIQFTPGLNDVVNLDANLSQTKFQVPFDTTGNTQLDDNQRDINSFVNLGWRHQFAGPEYSLRAAARQMRARRRSFSLGCSIGTAVFATPRASTISRNSFSFRTRLRRTTSRKTGTSTRSA